eukprot:s580_g6.t1
MLDCINHAVLEFHLVLGKVQRFSRNRLIESKEVLTDVLQKVEVPHREAEADQVVLRFPMELIDIQQSDIGMADVLNPQPKGQAVLPKPVILETPTHFVKKRIMCTSYNIQDDELRSRALNKFRVLVSLDLHATQIGV